MVTEDEVRLAIDTDVLRAAGGVAATAERAVASRELLQAVRRS